MKNVRIGIIGLGNMGQCHVRLLKEKRIRHCKLTAVCDGDKSRLKGFDNNIAKFTDSRKLIRSGNVDAILIATPHYSHTDIGIDALKQKLHVLVEKPISVHKADCKRLIAAHTDKKQVFAAMFNQRTNPYYKKIKELIDSGQLGKIMRVNWIVTNWFRPEYYYASGGWRATWAGEGGGVLLNQCPHQLDLLQWLCGMPKKVRGFCGLGKRHKIEVEDEVTAYLEYPNGATGVFITSTGEAPGTNRLEIAGDNGKIVLEDNSHSILFVRNKIPVTKFNKTAREAFACPAVEHIKIPVRDTGGQHKEIIQNFVDTILGKASLIAPAAEGIYSVELANAMLYSSLIGKPVGLPLESKVFERKLRKLIKESKFVKKVVRNKKKENMNASFN